MLLSKALRMQQDLEDKKHEVIIEGLESKMKRRISSFTQQKVYWQKLKLKLQS
jgi:hypothetical protein